MLSFVLVIAIGHQELQFTLLAGTRTAARELSHTQGHGEPLLGCLDSAPAAQGVEGGERHGGAPPEVSQQAPTRHGQPASQFVLLKPLAISHTGQRAWSALPHSEVKVNGVLDHHTHTGKDSQGCLVNKMASRHKYQCSISLYTEFKCRVDFIELLITSSLELLATTYSHSYLGGRR